MAVRHTNYVVERRELPTGVWTNVYVERSINVGTSVTDTRLVEGREYEFRIMAETAIGRSDPLVTDSPIKARDQSSMERRNIGNECEERSGGWGLNLSLTIYYLL